MIGSTLLLVTVSAAVAADVTAQPFKSGGYVELSGTISRGDAAKVADIIKSTQWEDPALYLDSPGGSALEGIRLGMLARLLGFTTVVGNRNCVSACALAWAGGEMRLMMPEARVGYHTTYSLDEAGQPLRSDEGNAVVRSYVALIGLGEEALRLMTAADPDEVTWLTPALADQAGISFYQLDPARDRIPFSQR